MCGSQIAVKYGSKPLQSKTSALGTCVRWVRMASGNKRSHTAMKLNDVSSQVSAAREAQPFGGPKIFMLPLNRATGIDVRRCVRGVGARRTLLDIDDAKSARPMTASAGQRNRYTVHCPTPLQSNREDSASTDFMPAPPHLTGPMLGFCQLDH